MLMHCISFLKVLLKYNTIYSPIVNAACGVVYPLVGRPSSPILEEILYSSHTQDEEDRYHGYLLAKRTYFRHPIQQDNENEIQVGHTMELLQQILRYEREQRILRCPYLVANKLTIGMIPLWGLRWHCVIGNHRSIASLIELVASVVIAQGRRFHQGGASVRRSVYIDSDRDACREWPRPPVADVGAEGSLAGSSL